MEKIALSMIVSGTEKVEDLQRCLNSVKPHVDGIYITITTKTKGKGLQVAAERYGAVVDYCPNKFFKVAGNKTIKWLTKNLGEKPVIKKGDKIFDFSAARNHNLERIPKDFGWILWMDVDDILIGGKTIKPMLAKSEKQGVESIFINYIYQAVMENGKVKQVVIEHLRERIVRHQDLYAWVAPIHETLIEKRPTRKIDFDKCEVLHLSTEERRDINLDRNIKTLEYNLWFTKGADPRPSYYLGKSYFDLFMQKGKKEYMSRAKRLFEIYLTGTKEFKNGNKSGWAEERSQCWEYLVEIYRQMGENNNAIKAAHNALIEDERFPSIYINLGLSYLVKGDYERARFWVKLSGKVPQPKTTLIINPRDLAGRAMEVIYHSGIHLSKLDEAWAAAVKLVELFPESKEMKQRLEFTQGLKKQKVFSKYIVDIVNNLSASGEGDKIKLLLSATPSFITNNPIITNIRKTVTPPKVWGEKDIVIYTGPGFTSWSPKSLEGNMAEFVGGSEEAVIYMSQALQKQGWQVTVFGEPGVNAGVYDGVVWQPHYEFNNLDEFNILISWRNLGFFDQEIKAKQKYCWAHDVLNNLEHTKERMAKINKVIVLSKAHRETIPGVPDEKVFISSNGFYEYEK